MQIEHEVLGGVVVRWRELGLTLLIDPTGARLVWNGHVLGSVVVGSA
jgi:hypothetical protein